jgi:hypothetical protein
MKIKNLNQTSLLFTFGIKIWILADSTTSFCYNAQIYLGRQQGQAREVGQAGRVVRDLIQPIEGSGRNVTTDQYFKSYDLATVLLQRNLTLVGTLNRNRVEVPNALLRSRHRQDKETLFCHSGEIMLLSHVPRKNKAVIILSSMHTTHEVNDNQLPHVIEDYNQMKGGVDNLNKLVATYTVRRKVFRWPAVLFFNSVDIAAVNALIIWLMLHPEWENTKKMRRRLYLRELSEALVAVHIAERHVERPRSIRRSVTQARRRFHPDNEEPIAINCVGERRGTCHLCNRRVKTNCSSCRRKVCPEHSRPICNSC